MAGEFDDLFPAEEEIFDAGVVTGDDLFSNELENDFFAPVKNDKDSLITDLLKSRGIENNSVKIIDENDEEKVVNFFELSKEEQLQILTDHDEPNIPNNLQEEENELINYLRENNLTLQEYLDLYKEDILKDINPNNSTVYEIDSYDDQELFILDLKSKFDLTDEELSKELEKELQDKDLFDKKVAKLRTDYKEMEDTYKLEQQNQSNLEREEQYNEFVDKMVDTAINTTDLFGFELEDDEKNNVLSYLLDLDDNGTSDFYKALNDPINLYKAAWFLSYGDKAFEALKDAYEAEITKLKKDGQKLIVREKNKPSNIHDLF